MTRLTPAISITRPGGSSRAVATAGTVLASVVQPLCTLNWKCTAKTYSDSRTSAENGVQVSLQLGIAARSARVATTAVAMISSAYTRTGIRMSGDSNWSNDAHNPHRSARGGTLERPPGQSQSKEQVANTADHALG